MKMIIAAIIPGLAIILAIGCGQQGADNKNHHHETAVVNSDKDSATGTLTLNAGKKWKLDESTRDNIKLIREALEKKAPVNQDYSALVTDLEGKSNKLVSECKMSGPDHDMLHIWLTDYLSALKEMKSGDAESQEESFHKIESQMRIFDQYFE